MSNYFKVAVNFPKINSVLTYKSELPLQKGQLVEVPLGRRTSHGGIIEKVDKILEDLKKQAPDYIYQRTLSPEKAVNKPEKCSLTFFKGNLVAVNSKKNSPKNLLKKLNELGGKHAIGRIDLVENRFLGIKSRGIYETPGGTILLFAHRTIESLTLNKNEQHTKDELMPKYAELIYNGFWFSKERKKLQKIIDNTQRNVEGTVKLKLYKGNIIILERFSKKSLYSKDLVSFEGNKVFNPKNTERLIKKKRYRF